jgi:hypothetical protein
MRIAYMLTSLGIGGGEHHLKARRPWQRLCCMSCKWRKISAGEWAVRHGPASRGISISRQSQSVGEAGSKPHRSAVCKKNAPFTRGRLMSEFPDRASEE